MNNLKLKILEQAYSQPGLTIGGLADKISRGAKTEQEVRDLEAKGYLREDGGLQLTKKGLAHIDSASFLNRTKRLGKGTLSIGAAVVAVVIGNWLWELIQPYL